MEEVETVAEGTLFKDPVGMRLRAARESANIDLAEIAARTRIPLRHLLAIEKSEFDKLPSSTYAIGFVKSYARALGLDEVEIGRDVRVEMGAPPAGRGMTVQQYDPIDPARIQPKWLVLTAVALAILLFGGYGAWRYYQSRTNIVATEATAGDAGPAAEVNPASTAPPAVTAGSMGNVAAPIAAASSPGTVVLTATKTAWVRIYDADDKVLYQNEMKAGNSFTVPTNANRPQIRTGAPEALTVTIDGKEVPPLADGKHMIKDVAIDAAALRARSSTASSASAAK